MARSTKTIVTFTVPPGIAGIPPGDHAGYVEHGFIQRMGQQVAYLARCMLHLERKDYPAYFSSQNSVISVDVDVISHVKANTITYV
jgi:hypothetical protein